MATSNGWKNTSKISNTAAAVLFLAVNGLQQAKTLVWVFPGKIHSKKK